MEQKKWWEKSFGYFAAAGIISLIFLGVCAGHRIFPFGSATIAIEDFEQQIIPVYYHLWDFLHGDGALMFDWNVGGGNNFAAVASQFTMISPFNLFFFLMKRSWIESSMVFFLLIKMIVMGGTMYFFLSHTNRYERKNQIYWIAAAVSYALSGYTFLYYGLSWLDTAAFFPILLYNFICMAKREPGWKAGRHTIGYILCYAVIFVMNIPQAYMVSIFMVFFAGGWFFIYREQQKISWDGILKFGMATLLALALSAAFFAPAARGILGSYRVSGESTADFSGFLALLKWPGMDAKNKYIMLFSVSLPLLCFFLLWKRDRKHVFWSYLLAVMILPVFVESISIVWHRGTYMCFSMRYGYMMVFSVLAASAQGLGEQERYRLWPGRRRAAQVCFGIAFLAWGVITAGLGYTLIRPNFHNGGTDFVADAQEVGEAVVSIAERQKERNADEAERDRERGGTVDVFHKIKTSDASLNNNYPLIAKSASYSNYLHLMTEEQIKMNRALGYAQTWTRLGDTGGTLLSDALLGYRYVISSKIPKDGGWSIHAKEQGICEEIQKTEHFSIYEYQNSPGPGIVTGECTYEQLNRYFTENVFENQSVLGEAVFGKQLIRTWEETFADADGSEQLSYKIRVEGRGALYLYSTQFSEAEFFVNGRQIPVPTYALIDNTKYPVPMNEGIISLGCYDTDTVDVVIRQNLQKTNTHKKFYVGILDLDLFEECAASAKVASSYRIDRTGCRIVADSQGGDYLFLPINADDGWRCTVNGIETGILRLYGNLMLIPLGEGVNEIELSFCPRGWKKGCYLSMAAAGAFLCWVILGALCRKDWLIRRIYSVCAYAAGAVFIVIFAALFAFAYAIPICYQIYLQFM